MHDFPLNNLLPGEGEVFYFGKIFSQKDADRLFEELLEKIDWKQDELVMFGKKIVTSRKTAWYGDKNFEYTYSKMTKKAGLWTPELLQVKGTVEEKTRQNFNSCLLNLYHSGEEGMGWHADNEPELGAEPAIASVSFGAARKFVLKHRKSSEKVSVALEHGSLLLIQGSTQNKWLHSLPKTKKVKSPRINLTFRNIKED